MKARIQFDGGCNPNPGSKYGSYEVSIDDTFNLTRNRFPLGYGTNNEAEFDSLLMALTDLHNACQRAVVKPGNVQVDIFTDSMIVKGWIRNYQSKSSPKKLKKCGERSMAMFILATKCIRQLEQFESFTIEWNPRQRNVERFGH